ncbi:hypothetical protein LVJ94_35335 [Pendulispora rubella]|uniref:Uncharacterized protein n=1 Tax=Pendulispora rubella TaxID=2741070 RepID=A0ABZ2KUI5_9BACT
MLQVLVVGQVLLGAACVARVAAEYRLHLRVVAKAKADMARTGEEWVEVKEAFVLSRSALRELESHPAFRGAIELARAFRASGRIKGCRACGSHVLREVDDHA